jgi:hypothetical protein
MELVGGKSRAIAQAVIRRLPMAAARFRAQLRSCGVSDRQSGIGAGFLRVLRFTLQILIPPTHHQLSSGAGIIGRLVAAVPSGLSVTLPQENKKKLTSWRDELRDRLKPTTD